MTVQNTSDFLAAPTRILLDEELSSFKCLLRGDEGCDSPVLERLDRILRLRIVRLLRTGAEAKVVIGEIDSLRRLMPHRRREEPPNRRWSLRWEALADLLDTYVLWLRSYSSRVMSLAHAEEILDLVKESPGLAQNEIGNRLGLKPPNLSRILGALEAQGHILRKPDGREKKVYATLDEMPVTKLQVVEQVIQPAPAATTYRVTGNGTETHMLVPEMRKYSATRHEVI